MLLRSDGTLYLVDFFGVGCKPCVEGFPTKFPIRDGRILMRRMGGSDKAYRIWKPLIAQALRCNVVAFEREDKSLPAVAPPPP